MLQNMLSALALPNASKEQQRDVSLLQSLATECTRDTAQHRPSPRHMVTAVELLKCC